MCRSFDIAKETVKEYIQKKEPFSFGDLQREIIRRDGVLRIAPGVTIGSYLKNLEDRNIIFYNQFSEKFDFIQRVEQAKVARSRNLQELNLTER